MLSRIFAFLLLLGIFLWPHPAAAQSNLRNYSVEAWVTVAESPPEITLHWRPDTNSVSYHLFRKSFTNQTWQALGDLSASSDSFTDRNVILGDRYEYKIVRNTASYKAYGYVLAGIRVPMVEQRGKIIILLDASHAGALASELSVFINDLTGDGWGVIRREVSRDATPASVKTIIQQIYAQDPTNTRALLLFGRIPVPYSGHIYPDGHANHEGAWPSDSYYADLDGSWTDTKVNVKKAERQIQWNIPGDGKFDQNLIPSKVELEVGRVDFFEMTNFSNKQPPRSERDLLRQYLVKNHRFRHVFTDVQRRAIICDNFGLRGTDSVVDSGWRNFAPMFRPENVTEVLPGTWLKNLETNSYLWSWAAGGGSYYYSDGVARSDDFAIQDPKVVFMMFLGSYFGDWDNESNFLKAAIGSSSHTLASCYGGFPHWFFHPMALGETLGACLRITQDNVTNQLYFPFLQGTHETHIALLGDPTLRLHTVLPPKALTRQGGSDQVELSWEPSFDSSLLGYHLYRRGLESQDWERISGETPLSGGPFTDLPSAGSYQYMVRAVKLEKTPSGSYLNGSQGIFITAETTGIISTNSFEFSGTKRSSGNLTSLLIGKEGSRAVLERTADFNFWIPILTNHFTESPTNFTQQISSEPQNFYRLRELK